MVKLADITIVILCFFVFSGCCPFDKEYCVQNFSIDMENGLTNQGTRIEGNAHSGKFYSRIDGNNQFGSGLSISLPDSLVTKRAKLIFSVWIRSNVLQTKGSMALSITKGITPVSWNIFMTAGAISEPNQWTLFRDSIELPKRINGCTYNKIALFSFIEKNAPEKFDIDDLNITIKTY